MFEGRYLSRVTECSIPGGSQSHCMTYSCFFLTHLLWSGLRLMSHGAALSFHPGKIVPVVWRCAIISITQTDSSCLNCSTGQPHCQGLSLDDMRRSFQYPAVDKNGEELRAPRAQGALTGGCAAPAEQELSVPAAPPSVPPCRVRVRPPEHHEVPLLWQQQL